MSGNLGNLTPKDLNSPFHWGEHENIYLDKWPLYGKVKCLKQEKIAGVRNPGPSKILPLQREEDWVSAITMDVLTFFVRETSYEGSCK